MRWISRARRPDALDESGEGPIEPARLDATAISKRFGRRVVLDGATVSVRAGEAVALVGENGAGKSTLLRSCAGLIAPDSGNVAAHGRVGYCPQEPGLVDLLTTDEHLALFAPGLGLTREQAAHDGRTLLSELAFPAEDRSQARHLSGGALQKLNLALALLGDARVLLLDEPYQGFDHGSYVSFWDHVARWKAEGRAVLIVTHLLADTALVDRVVELSIPAQQTVIVLMIRHNHRGAEMPEFRAQQDARRGARDARAERNAGLRSDGLAPVAMPFWAARIVADSNDGGHMTDATRAVVVGPNDGTRIEGPVGGPLTFKVRGEQTNGALAALENVIPPGQGPPLHTHANEDESWYVIEGELRFKLAGDVQCAPAGSFVFVPRGTPHCFQNIADAPARILVMFTPAGMERFFDRFAALSALDPEAFGSIGRPLGMEIIGPPLAQTDPV